MKRTVIYLLVPYSFILSVIITQSGCKDKNSPPEIQSIIMTPSADPVAGTLVELTVIATDPDKDQLQYSWSAEGGDFIGQNNNITVSWKSPVSATVHDYEISVVVSDQIATATGHQNIHVLPLDAGLDAYPKILDFGATANTMLVKLFNTGYGQLNWDTSGEDAPWLTVNPAGGTINSPDDTVYVELQVDREELYPDTYIEDFIFRNSDSTSDYVTINVSVNVPQTYTLNGYAYYSSTSIPITGVNISLGGQNYITAENGFYEFNGIISGAYALSATKDGFDNFFAIVDISSTKMYNIDMTSGTLTHKLFGYITNQEQNPISMVKALLLNPDGSESELETTSDTAGFYQLEGVPVGERKVRYSKITCSPVELDVNLSGSDYQQDVEMTEFGLPCPGTPNVTYEGKTYNTVLIGNQCWLKENLNIGTMIGLQYMEDNGIIEKYCYDGLESNCDCYGGLYQWNEIMQYISEEGTQGICPPGWHIPTDAEWKTLEGTVDSKYNVGDAEWNKEDYRGFDAGKNLKSDYGWYNYENGADIFHFTALPGGHVGTEGYGLWIKWGHFCTSTKSEFGDPYIRVLYYYNDNIARFDSNNGEAEALSVRCLKN